MAVRKPRRARPSRKVVAGAAAGVAVGAVAAGALAAQRRLADRKALDQLDVEQGFEHTPDEQLTVVADDGVALHVEIDHPVGGEGSEPATVVFSHGYTLNLKGWVLQVRALKGAGYRVVAWDQRSHGRSAEADGASCTIEQLGADLRSVIAATCPEGPIVLVGHSMGGMTTMSYASQFPEELRARVLAVGLVATAAVGEGLTDLRMGRYVGRAIGWGGPLLLLRLARHQGFLNSVRPFGRAAEDALVMRVSFDSPVSERLVRFVADLIFATPFAVMAAFLPSLGRFDVRSGLEAMRGIEVLVINGEGDLLTPPSYSEEIVTIVPGAEHVVVRDSGHLIMLEHPTLVSEQLLLLIERARRAREEKIPVSSKPRVVRTITDIARARRVAKAKARAGRG